MSGNPETEWLRELDAAREAHKLKMHKLKMSLQERTERIDYLEVDRERIRQEREFIKESLNAEIKWLKLTYARETGEFNMMLAGATYDRACALEESRKARKSLDESHREIEVLHRQLSHTGNSNRMAAERLDMLSKGPHSDQETKAATQRSLCREADEKDRAVLLNQQLTGELDDLRCRLQGNDIQLKNLRNALQREGESLKGATEENQILKEEIAELKASNQRAVDESTTLLQSLKREPEAKIATQRFPGRDKDEKGRALSRNEQLTGELEDLRRQLESNDIELINLRGAFQHEQESFRGAAEENRKLKEEVVHLSESHRRATTESTVLSQSLRQEREDKAVTQRSLHRERDEKDRVLSRNERLTGELDSMKRQLEGNNVELVNLRNALQHEKLLSKRGTEENWMLQEEIARLGASYQRAVDESTALSQSLKQEQEDRVATLRSPRWWEDEMDRALSQNKRLTREVDDLRRQLESNDIELKGLQNGLQYERESLEGAAEENLKLKEELNELRASHQRAVVESTSLSLSFKREQEDRAAALGSVRRWEDENGRALSQIKQLTDERDSMKHKLDSDDVGLKNLRNTLRHEKESFKGAAEEIRKLKEEIAQLRESHRRAIDESTTFSQSLGREQEGKAAAQQSLRREKDETSRIVSQSQRLTGELDSLRRQLESKDVELRNLRNALQQEKESFKGEVEENWKLKEEVAKLKASHRRAVDESIAISQSLKREREGKVATHVIGELGGLKHQPEGKETELNNLRSALQQSQTKNDELTTLLETRSRELKGAQVYLTKADTLSGAEVVALVDALNSEILQASAFISDSFDYAREPAHADGTKAASTGISEFIGSTLARLISTVSHSDNDFLVQIALQSAAVELSHRIILTWDFVDLQAKQPLAKLYGDIRETGQVRSLNRITRTDDRTETQAVGGRWRALTRAHAQKVALWEGNPHAMMVAGISDTLVAILVAARCTKNYEETHRKFTHSFGEHVSGIVKMALRLNKAMGEEVTSADLRPVNVASGEIFDGSTMADFESRREDLKGQVVLCTTALGMQRSEKVVRGDLVEFETTILLKPRVAVESVVDAVDG